MNPQRPISKFLCVLLLCVLSAPLSHAQAQSGESGRYLYCLANLHDRGKQDEYIITRVFYVPEYDIKKHVKVEHAYRARIRKDPPPGWDSVRHSPFFNTCDDSSNKGEAENDRNAEIKSWKEKGSERVYDDGWTYTEGENDDDD